MASPLVSILLPHLRNPRNDEALHIALSCLVDNTTLDYELIIEAVEERRDIYPVLNSMAEQAISDWIIPYNSDVFCAPHWLEPIWAARDENTIVSPVMVECGAIPVNNRNLERDFGRTPRTFQRNKFEAWVSAGGGWRDDWHDGEAAWFFPSMLPRKRFLDLGGFDTSLGEFPHVAVDIAFWDTWATAGGKFNRVHSFVYHLQAFSDTERGNREVALNE